MPILSGLPGPEAETLSSAPTAHAFSDDIHLGVTPAGDIKSGIEVRISEKDSPPRVFFDAVYAAATLKTTDAIAPPDETK